MGLDACPTLEDLEQLAAGGCVSGDITVHVSTCARCREEVERARCDNQFLARFRGFDRDTAAPAPARAPTGQALADLVPGYAVIRQIYAGGQGVVYEALQKATKRTVAVKVLAHAYGSSPRRVRRFEREIEVIAALRHPNVVTVFDSGMTADGRLFFAMEYVEGRTLGALMRQRRLGVREALVLFAKIARAVTFVHQHGVIHRDVKPGNVLIDGSGEPRVVDFGVAKVTGSHTPAGPAITISGEFMGTIAYAAPEQVSGHPDRVDIRADVYALGVVLYEMLAGRLPYEVGGSVTDMVRAVTEAEPRRPIDPAVDGDLETIVLKALARERERRYQSAGALADDVDRYLRGEAIDARRDSTWYVLKKTLRRYWIPAAIVAAGVLVISAVAVVMTIQAGRIARERDRADESAAGLGSALRESDFQRGRALTAAGNYVLAESLLWREFLRPVENNRGREPLSPGAAAAIDDAGSPHGFWALWELYARMRCLATLAVHEPTVPAVAFSPDGRTLASGGRESVRLWSLDGEGAAGPVVLAARGDVHQVVFTPDGRTLVSTSRNGPPILWDLGASPLVPSPLSEAGPAASIALAPGGRGLATGGWDGTVGIWDLAASARLVGSTVVGGGQVTVSFNHDGRLLACGHGAGIDVVDAREGRIVASSPHGFASVPSFSPDGSFIVFAREENLYRWDAPFTQPPSVGRSRSDAWLVASAPQLLRSFHPRGHLLALGVSSGVVELWDVETARRAGVLAGHSVSVGSVAFSPDGDVLASTSGDGSIRLWDVAPRRGELVVGGFIDSANSLAFSADGTRLAAAGGHDRALRVCDVASGEWTLVIPDTHADAVVAVAYSPDGSMLASAGHDHVARIWDGRTGRCLRTLAGHTGWVQTVQFSPDGSVLATGGYDGTLRFWDAASGQCTAVVDARTNRTPKVRFSPDGSLLASCGHELLIWDVASHQVVQELAGHSSQVRAIGWSRDGRWLASGADDLTIKLWDVRSGSCHRTMDGHPLHIFTVDVSPDGQYVASGDRGGEVRLWDTATGRHLITLSGGTGEVLPPVFTVLFSPDGRRLAIGTGEPGIRLWDLTYHARHITGNLEYQIGRLPPEERDSQRIGELRAWAARVR